MESWKQESSATVVPPKSAATIHAATQARVNSEATQYATTQMKLAVPAVNSQQRAQSVEQVEVNAIFRKYAQDHQDLVQPTHTSRTDRLVVTTPTSSVLKVCVRAEISSANK